MYDIINTSILQGEDVPKDIIKDTHFYEYLLNNRIATYYSKNLSKESNPIEKQIILCGNSRNRLFFKTLEELDKICKLNNIQYLLYKTYKYFDEVIGGDIDIVIEKKDFEKMLQVMTENGWTCKEDEPGKGKCEKKGYINIEPHTKISRNNIELLPTSLLLTDTKKYEINGKEYAGISDQNESIGIYLKVIFSPEYLDLYDLKMLQQLKLNIKSIENPFIKDIISHIQKKISSNTLHGKLPLFLSSFDILWFNIIFFLKYGELNKYMFIHNLYWKHRYKINGKLPFLTKYIDNLEGNENK